MRIVITHFKLNVIRRNLDSMRSHEKMSNFKKRIDLHWNDEFLIESHWNKMVSNRNVLKIWRHIEPHRKY